MSCQMLRYRSRIDRQRSCQCPSTSLTSLKLHLSEGSHLLRQSHQDQSAWLSQSSVDAWTGSMRSRFRPTLRHTQLVRRLFLYRISLTLIDAIRQVSARVWETRTSSSYQVMRISISFNSTRDMIAFSTFLIRMKKRSRNAIHYLARRPDSTNRLHQESLWWAHSSQLKSWRKSYMSSAITSSNSLWWSLRASNRLHHHVLARSTARKSSSAWDHAVKT